MNKLYRKISVLFPGNFSFRIYVFLLFARIFSGKKKRKCALFVLRSLHYLCLKFVDSVLLILAPAADSITLKSRFNLFLRFTDFRWTMNLCYIKIQTISARGLYKIQNIRIIAWVKIYFLDSKFTVNVSWYYAFFPRYFTFDFRWNP